MKSRAERLQVIQEVQSQLTTLGLNSDLGTQVLNRILADYLETGSPYLGKELRIIGNSSPAMRNSVPSKYVINLYNDPEKRDTIVIRPQEEK
jgi:hypothetical protein